MVNPLELLGYAGNLLDLPGSSVRDLLTGQNPFDQWMTPFSGDNRATGRDVLHPILGANKETGMSGWLDDPMEGVKDVLGFGAEVALDPMNFVSGGAVLRAIKGGKAARQANAVNALREAGKYSYVNPRVLARQADEMANPIAGTTSTVSTSDWAKQISDLRSRKNQIAESSGAYDGWGVDELFEDVFGTTDNTVKAVHDAGRLQEYNDLSKQIWSMEAQNPMKLLGYTPERETVFHGGRDWSASATPEHPYGIFDMRRLKTGEGANAYGPGMYAADQAGTTKSYTDRINNMSPEPNPQAVKSIYQRLKDTFVPGRDIPAGQGQMFDDIIELGDSTVDDIFAVGPDGTNYQRSRYPVVGMRPVEWQGDNLVYDLLHATPEGIATVRDMYTPGFHENDWADYFGINVDYVQPQGRFYQLDMPVGSKERFMKWENPLRNQSENVQKAVFDKVPGLDSAMDEYADAWKKWGAAKTETRRLRMYDSEYLNTPEGMRLEAARQLAWNGQLSVIEDLVRRTGMSEYTVRRLLEHGRDISGENIADVLMGNTPSSATLADTAGLREAGVPGMKNLSHATPGSYNYAIWDQDLINQMRIRAIDGERVPINPTTLVQQVEQPTFRAAAGDSPLVSTMNPMRPQAVPSVLKPLAAGAAYNALARQNQYGGIM